MKKYNVLFFIVFILFVLSACGSNENNTSKQENNNSTDDVNAVENNSSENDEDKSVEVDKNLLSVEITFPANFFELGDEDEELDFDELSKEAKEQGVKEVTQNDDGSITYKMTKSAHKELMKEIKESMIDSFDEISESDDFQSIKDISPNKNFDEINIMVDKEQFENSFDGFAVLGLAFTTMYYQMFDGAGEGDYDVTFNFVDESTNEVFDSSTFPDDFDM